jgi:hypothetical protein
MSRIAEAYARAGRRLPIEDEHRWETEREIAARHLDEYQVEASVAQSRTPIPNPQSPIPDPIDFELASAVRNIFLSPKASVRSVLFCAAPGDVEMTDVAWRAAEVLAAQSGKPVAFVEDPNNRAPHQSAAHALITRIDWCPVDDDAVPSRGVLGDVASPRKTNDVLGEQIAELFPRFAYVVVNVTAPMNELRPLARQVDGVIVVVAEGKTPSEAAQTFVSALRADARLLGAILTT